MSTIKGRQRRKANIHRNVLLDNTDLRKKGGLNLVLGLANPPAYMAMLKNIAKMSILRDIKHI